MKTPKIYKVLEAVALLFLFGGFALLVTQGWVGKWPMIAGLAGFVSVRAVVWWKFG